MAKKSMENGALNITLTYLKQAQRLSHILCDYGDEDESSTYLNQIEPLMRQTCKYMRYSSVTGPSLPRRGSTDPPNLAPPPRKRSLGESTLNLTARRQSGEDSDDTLRMTKPRRPMLLNGGRSEATTVQVHHRRLDFDERGLDPKPIVATRKPLRAVDNVRIRS